MPKGEYLQASLAFDDLFHNSVSSPIYYIRVCITCFAFFTTFSHVSQSVSTTDYYPTRKWKNVSKRSSDSPPPIIAEAGISAINGWISKLYRCQTISHSLLYIRLHRETINTISPIYWKIHYDSSTRVINFPRFTNYLYCK